MSALDDRLDYDSMSKEDLIDVLRTFRGFVRYLGRNLSLNGKRRLLNQLRLFSKSQIEAEEIGIGAGYRTQALKDLMVIVEHSLNFD